MALSTILPIQSINTGHACSFFSLSLSFFSLPHGLPLLSCWRIIMYIVSGQQTCSAAAAALAIERRPAKPNNNRTRTLYRNRRLCYFLFYDGHVWVDEAWFSQVLSVRRNSSPCQQEKWYRIRELYSAHHQSAIAIVMGPNYDISLARRPLYASGTRFFQESRENERKLWSVRELLSRRRFDRLFFLSPPFTRPPLSMQTQ